MTLTLEDILQRIGGYVDQDTSTPTGTDLTTRTNYVNRAINEWASAYQWRPLRKKFEATVLLSATSIGLPTNFKKLMSPAYDMSKSTPDEYREIRGEEKYLKNSSDKYVVVRGDIAAGRYIEVNPPLASGASLVMEYQSFPSSLATLTDVPQIPDPEYLVQRSIAYVLESRSDTRFPQVKSDADRLLSQMIEEEIAPSGGQNNRVPDTYRRNNFRIGYDG